MDNAVSSIPDARVEKVGDPDTTVGNLTPINNGGEGSKNVFITGAATGVGRETARQLVKAGYTVTGTAATIVEATALRADGVMPAYPDIRRAGELRSAMRGQGARILIHLATQTTNHLPQQVAAWDADLAAGAAALVQAAHDADAEFIVYGSYAFAEGETEDETVRMLLRGVRKAEKTILTAETPACVLRFGYIYGSHSPQLETARAILQSGRPSILGSSVGRALWVYEADAAAAIVRAVEMRPAGQTLGIVDDQPATPAEFLTYFAEAQGYSAPGKLPPFVGRFMENKTQSALMALSPHNDNHTAREALGWTPRFTHYRAGLDDLLLSWRAQLSNQS